MAYVTLDDVREFLKLESGSDDDLIADLINEAVTWFEEETRRKFEASSDSTRTFDAIEDVYGSYLVLDEDLCAITSVTNGDSTTVTSSQYVTEPRNDTPYHALKIRGDASISWTYGDYPENAISIVGRWAWSTTPPNDVKYAIKRLVKHWYQVRGSSGDLDRPLLTGDGVTILPSRVPAEVQQIALRYKKTVEL